MTATLTVRPANLAARPALPSIRIRPVPRLEPPPDDDEPDVGCALSESTPTLPIQFGPPAVGVNRNATTQSVAPPAAGSEAAAPEPGRASAAPLVARRFVSTCLEVIGGYRPATHLRPLCSPELFDRVIRLLTGRGMTAAPSRTLSAARPTQRSPVAGRLSARSPVPGRSRTGAPPRSGRAEQKSPGDRIDIRRIQLGEPIKGVAEVAVVLARQEEVWAMALRLEERKGRWICTALDVL